MTAQVEKASRQEFALLCYQTENLGDEIQSFAAAQFLPGVDDFVDREALNTYEPPDRVTRKIILNGWFMHRPENWPPSSSLQPLFISFHLNNTPKVSGYLPSDLMLSGRCRDYMMEFGPVGTRDLHTLNLLTDHRIQAYFSGCLTLTLPRPAVPVDEDLIVLNDIPEHWAAHIKGLTRKRVVEVSQVTACAVRHERFKAAYRLLETYARASLVVTSRLHCALPCLAFGTPVCFVETDHDTSRFPGLTDLLRTVPADVPIRLEASDLDDPPPNWDSHLQLRGQLLDTVQGFVGLKMPRTASPYANVLGCDAESMNFIEAAYRALLDKDPDLDGLLSYSRLLRAEGAVAGGEKMLKSMLASREDQTRHPH